MLESPRAPLKDCVRSAYAATLRKHHGVLVRGVFGAAVNAAPARAAFVATLAPAGASEAEAMHKLRQLRPALRRPLDVLDKYLAARGIEA
jgi:pleckstrin family protein A (phosphoinositide binding specific) protein 8